jgi:hypothetical protein
MRQLVSVTYVAMVDVSWLGRGVERVAPAGVYHEELDDHRGHEPRRDLDDVLPRPLVLRHGHLLPHGVPAHVAADRVVEPLHAVLELLQAVELPRAHGLERGQVEVQRVVVLREVDHLPHLRGARPRRLRRRVLQPLPVDVQVRRVARRLVLVLVQHDVPPPRRVLLGDLDVVQQPRRHPRVVVVVPHPRRLDDELHHLAVEVVRRVAVGVRVRRRVDELRLGGRALGEIDDDVERLGRGDEEVRHGDRPGQVAGVGADDVERDQAQAQAVGGGGQGEVEEARVAGVDDAEAVAAARDAEERPGLAVDGDGLPEVLGLPLRVDARVVAGAVHVERAVGVEAAVCEHEHPVEGVAAGEAERRLRRRVPDDVGAEEAREEVGAREAERVVVVPERAAGRLHVRVRVRGRRPRGAPLPEARGEPGVGVAVGLRRVDAAVGTPPPLGMAVGTVGSHGRMWRSGRWFSHVTCSGTPCSASMVGPGKVALSADVPNTNTVVGGRSRWNFYARAAQAYKKSQFWTGHTQINFYERTY